MCALCWSTYSFLHARRIRRTASIKEAVRKNEVADSRGVVVHLIRNRSATIRNRKNQCQDTLAVMILRTIANDEPGVVEGTAEPWPKSSAAVSGISAKKFSAGSAPAL